MNFSQMLDNIFDLEKKNNLTEEQKTKSKVLEIKEFIDKTVKDLINNELGNRFSYTREHDSMFNFFFDLSKDNQEPFKNYSRYYICGKNIFDETWFMEMSCSTYFRKSIEFNIKDLKQTLVDAIKRDLKERGFLPEEELNG